jgi:CheY-like chemotaxis protein
MADSEIYSVAFIGFSAFELDALGSTLRLATLRAQRYRQLNSPDAADLIVADAGQPDCAARLVEAGKADRCLLIGGRRPDAAAPWLPRPIDPLQVLRELDRLAAAVGHCAPPPAPRLLARALLVDDSDIALVFLRRLLERRGIACDRAMTSGAALELLERQRYDLIFLDIELGEASDTDGLALCQVIKRNPGHRAPTPFVIMLSAHAGEIDRARGALAGCDAYLAKPLDEELLDRALAQRGAGEAAGSTVAR